MMDLNVTLAHLYALRAHLDAVILAAETEAGPGQTPLEPGSCPQCGASADKIEDRSTLDGTRRDRCTNCGYEWERFPVEAQA
jgi:hypothetical protein